GESILKKTQMFLLITAGILVVIVTGYHFLIYDILNGLSDISGWSAACSLLAIFVVVAFCLGISWKNQSLKQENQILEVREKLELDNMRDMTKALEQNRIQVHDMRHHMIILREYALKKEYEAIETYLDQLLESYVEVQEERWTRIRNLDILLSEKKKEANLENIRFQIETDVLQSLPFKETETSVLFGNLLDNAIEACKKMKTETRWIRVEIRQRKGFLFFTIANSIGKRPQEKDGQFVSDKEDKKVHGYGLKSIRRIVKKYGGSFQCDVVEEEVKISISFSNK
ncbi:sensor histidine kinase, partial [Sellimonas intestinalis]